MTDKPVTLNEKDDIPVRFKERITAILGEEASAFLASCQTKLPRTFRHIKNEIPKEWKTQKVGGVPDSYFWTIPREDLTFGHTIEHFTGRVYSQSLSSMIPPLVLNLEPGMKVLDMCAAPGSKTLQLSQAVGVDGVVVANEISSSRSKKLSANIIRCGAKNVVITQHDGTKMPQIVGQEFDAVMLDAPCSSESHARRNPKYLKNHWNERYIHEAKTLQKGLIISAFRLLAPGGVMTYSTCTTAPEENEEVVKHLKEKFPEEVEVLKIELDKEIPFKRGLKSFEGADYPDEISENVVRIYPHMSTKNWDSECFFVCKIYKKRGIMQTPPVKRPPKDFGLRLRKNARAEFMTRIAKMFGLEKSWAKGFDVLKKDGAYSICSNRAITYALRNPSRKVGLKVMDKYGNIENAFAWAWGQLATKNVMDVSDQEAKDFLAGKDIDLQKKDGEFEDKNFYIIRSKNMGLGICKIYKKGTAGKNMLGAAWRIF